MTLSPEAEARIEEMRVRVRQQRESTMDDDGLAWLVAVPSWTVDLAAACGFPTGSHESVPALLAAADERGFASRNQEMDGNGQFVASYTATDRARSVLASRVESDEGTGPAELRDQVHRAASAIQSAGTTGDDVDVPRELLAWASIAGRATAPTGNVDGWYFDELNRLLDAGRTGQALEWLRAGEAVSALVSGELTSTVERARRRVGQHYRTREDQRFLDKVVVREDLRASFTELLDARDHWALHYVGRGGVGKTMHIRYLAGPYAADVGRPPFPVARVDFDHISPTYPTAEPGELLRVLGEELAGLIQTSTAEQHFLRYREHLRRLGTDSGPPSADPLARLHTEDFALLLESFADFLTSLGSDTVVLVLDTCEELAKLHPAGIEVPGIRATFEIMERLREATGGRGVDLKVVFAGRRLLATGGHGWSVEPATVARSVGRLQERPYLRLVDIRGFTRDQVDHYLQEKWSLELTTDQVDQLCGLARDRASASHAGLPAPDTLDRYNPFDLNVYARWLSEGGTIEGLREQAGDPYVSVRILGRIREDRAVVDAMPAVALFGRFTEEMLAAVVPAPGRMFTILGEQEWITSSGPVHGADRWLEVDRGLLDRLRRHLLAERPVAWQQACGALGPAMAELTRRPLREVAFEHVDVTLRCLPDGKASQVWADLEGRVVETGQWAWAKHVTERFLGALADARAEVDAEPSPLPGLLAARPALEAAIRLLSLDASAVVDRTLQGPQAWEEVGALARRHPDPATRRVLDLRSRLGVVAADARVQGERADQLAELLPAVPTEQPWLAPTVGALDAVMDALASPDRDEVVETILPAPLERLEPVRDPNTIASLADRLAAWMPAALAGVDPDDPAARLGRVLTGRLLSTMGRPDAAAWFSDVPREWADPGPDSRGIATVRGWVVPAGLGDRVVLEWLLAQSADDAARAGVGPDGAPPPLASLGADDTPDSDRRLSLQIAQRLAWEPLDAGELAPVAEHAIVTDHAAGSRRVHHVVPRLAATMSDALLANGSFGAVDSDVTESDDPMTAQQLLRTVRSREDRARVTAAGSTGDRDLARAVLHLVRRSRQVGGWRRDLLRHTQSDDPRLVTAAWSAMALCGEPVSTATPASDWPDWRLHAWWQVQSGPDVLYSSIDVLGLFAGRDDPDLLLDRLEAALMLDRRPQRDLVIADLRAALQPLPPRARVRPLIRARHVLGLAVPMPDGVPPRTLAQVVLEEAELLALRQPEVARHALGRAVDLFRSVDDPVGSFQARFLSERAGAAPRGGGSVRSLVLDAATAASLTDEAVAVGAVRRDAEAGDPRGALRSTAGWEWWADALVMADGRGGRPAAAPRSSTPERTGAPAPRSPTAQPKGTGAIGSAAQAPTARPAPPAEATTPSVFETAASHGGVRTRVGRLGARIEALASVGIGVLVLPWVVSFMAVAFIDGFLSGVVNAQDYLLSDAVTTLAATLVWLVFAAFRLVRPGRPVRGMRVTLGMRADPAAEVVPAALGAHLPWIGRVLSSWAVALRMWRWAGQPPRHRLVTDEVRDGRLPESFRRVIFGLAATSTRRPMRFVVAGTVDDAADDWESTLAEVLPPDGPKAATWTWREVHGAEAGPDARSGQPGPDVGQPWSRPRTQRPVVALVPSGWRSMTDLAWNREVEFADPAAALPTPERFLHLMGAAATTATGLSLRLDEHQEIAQKAASGAVSQVLRSPDTLPLDGGRPVVIVQGTPRSGPAPRAALGDLRRLAAELVLAGAGFVVVLPSLPETVAVSALVSLRAWEGQVGRRPLVAARLLAKLESLRTSVETEATALDGAWSGVRHDLSLFARADLCRKLAGPPHDARVFPQLLDPGPAPDSTPGPSLDHGQS